MQAGGQLDLQEGSGKTALHLAVSSGAKDVVAGLLAAGASCAVLDEGGCTPLHYAAQLCDLDIFNLIYAQPTSSAAQPDANGDKFPSRLLPPVPCEPWLDDPWVSAACTTCV